MFRNCATLFMILGTLYQQCKTCDIEARTFVDSNTRMTGFTILSAPAADLASCAKACLRVKQCASFNYDLSSRLCDLNSVSSTNHPEVMTHASRSLHSDIVEWPAMLDPDCSSRPCGIDEVCVPGQFGQPSGGPGSCSYSCMKFMATKMNSVSTTASTSSTSTSTPATTTTTTPAPATTTTTTSTTTPTTTTSTTTPTTTTTSTTTPTTTTSTTSTPATTSTTTPAPATTTTTTTSTTTPTTTTTTTSTTTPTTTTTTTSTTTPTTTTSTTTTSTTQATTQPTVEGDIRVVNGADNSQGRLEIYHNGGWATVSEDKWNWKATRTACKELGYSFGGSYHRHEAYGSGSGSAYKLNNIDCSDSDVRLRDCDIDSYDQHNDANKHLGITCYTENMEDLIPIEFRTGPEFLRIKDNDDTDVSNRVGLAQVKYQNVWGTICGEGWSYTEEFCKLKNSNWEKDNECKNDCSISASGPMWLSDVKCEDGDEPHIFYCRTNGWGNLKDNCDNTKAINVDCRVIS